MKRWSLLLAGAALWLFLAAIPALADGGPHVSLVNSGSSSLTADSCAGCHRAHTAQGEFLLAAASEEALCLSCHGNGGTGATTNVEWGIQFVPTGTGTRSGTELGALRNGGFLKARIDTGDPTRVAYIRGYENSPINTEFAISQRPRVGALGASEDVASAHIDLSPSAGDGIADTGTVWGKGEVGLGTPLVTLTCVECHNPHGNGYYRILRPVPGVESDPLGEPEPVVVKATYTNFDTIVTEGQHALVVNDAVTLTGVGGLADGTYYVAQVTNGFTFKVAASLATVHTVLNVTDTTNAGTVLRSQVPIADVAIDPDGDPDNGIENPTKNYTIIQTKGSQGVASTYLLYARDVINARTAANLLGVDEDQPAVTIDQSYNGGSGTSYFFQTTGAHGLAVGDLVDIAGGPWPGLAVISNPYTVASVSSSGTVYDRFTLVGVTLSGNDLTDGTVVRKGIPGDYSATGGDYFRRLLPWNPALVNPSCSNTTFSSNNSAYCGTANDAPNGRPGTITPGTGGSGPSSLFGQQAFLDQISTWCSQCHTRYYSNSNENLEGAEPISAIADRGIGRISGTTQIYPVYYNSTTQYGGPSYGDRVTFAGFTGGNAALNNTAVSITGVAAGLFTTGTNHGFVVGQTVMISTGITGLPAGQYEIATVPNLNEFTLVTSGATAGTGTATGTWYVIETGGSSSSGTWFKVATTKAGTAFVATNAGSSPYTTTLGTFTRVYQSSNSSWGYPREDATFKFQHSTASNRACTVCHVSHGSNATVTGQNGTEFSLNVTYPDGTTTSTSSRLLKVDNRGTCQMCHDPTGTVAEGTQYGPATQVP